MKGTTAKFFPPQTNSKGSFRKNRLEEDVGSNSTFEAGSFGVKEDQFFQKASGGTFGGWGKARGCFVFLFFWRCFCPLINVLFFWGGLVFGQFYSKKTIKLKQR